CFFQAEDGIRYRTVTGVQTCALPIWALIFLLAPRLEAVLPALPALLWVALAVGAGACALWFVLLLLSFYGSVLLLPEGLLERGRSEERRVGEERGSRGWRWHRQDGAG